MSVPAVPSVASELPSVPLPSSTTISTPVTSGPVPPNANDRPFTYGDWIQFQSSGKVPLDYAQSKEELEEERIERRKKKRIIRKIRAYYRDTEIAEDLKELEIDPDDKEGMMEQSLDELEENLDDIRDAVFEASVLLPIRTTIEYAAPRLEKLATSSPLIRQFINLKGLEKVLTKDQRMQRLFRILEAEAAGMFDMGPLMTGVLTVGMVIKELDLKNQKEEEIFQYVAKYETLPEDQIQELSSNTQKMKGTVEPELLKVMVQKKVDAIKAEIAAKVAADSVFAERMNTAYQKFATKVINAPGGFVPPKPHPATQGGNQPLTLPGASEPLSLSPHPPSAVALAARPLEGPERGTPSTHPRRAQLGPPTPGLVNPLQALQAALNARHPPSPPSPQFQGMRLANIEEEQKVPPDGMGPETDEQKAAKIPGFVNWRVQAAEARRLQESSVQSTALGTADITSDGPEEHKEPPRITITTSTRSN